MGESGWQILRAEADDLRRKLENVHEGRKRAIERARAAESLNTRYKQALEEVKRVGTTSYPKLALGPYESAEARIARKALAPSAEQAGGAVFSEGGPEDG